ncbi:MAG TPA: phosphoenolpyruvate--protein phosphotransferase [Bryobacteraceae bacterium]
MIGIVVVSHSARLAEGVCELAAQVAQGKVLLAPAGGTDDPQNPIGTDAFRVMQAIESVYSPDGVLVFMDLGSAVLSAETALELLDEDKRAHVRLCSAPVVEGAISAASLAAAGAAIEEILREMRAAPQAAPAPPTGPVDERLVTITNRLGLHARPAAQLLRLVRRFQSRVTIENVSHPAGPFEANGIHGILSLGARQGHQLRLRAEGPDAPRALAELEAFIQSGSGDREERREPAPPGIQAPGARALAGIAASAGIAIAPLFRLRPAHIRYDAREVEDPEAQRERLLAAIRAAQDETRTLYDWAARNATGDEAAIFDAQSLFLEDPALLDAASQMVLDRRVNAEFAWQESSARIAAEIRALDDPYLRARVADVEDIAARVLRRLSGGATLPLHLQQPSILAAHDLTPSQVQEFDPALVLGLCLESGSASSHSVILARALGIPVVAGLGPSLSALPEGTIVALDGERGTVWISPDSNEVEALNRGRAQWLDGRRKAGLDRHRPAATRDGRAIKVLANISGVAEAADAVSFGAEGVGVLRTEFLFLHRTSAPGEEEQVAAYRAIAQALGGRPLIVRTLDVGGDKSLPYVDIGEEANPFLGWRGIRITLGRRDLFRTQLRAILRAGADHAVSLLLPMVASLDELRETKTILREVEAELHSEAVPFRKNIAVGVMIEVPAAVALAPELAREAAFFSIGSNDLIQYSMAADRTNSRVAALADSFQPAVLRMIRQAVEAGRSAGIDVTLCGELAADPLATPLLLGMGLAEFSVSAALVPGLKQAIARWTIPEAEAIARKAMDLDSCAAVRRLLSDVALRE